MPTDPASRATTTTRDRPVSSDARGASSGSRTPGGWARATPQSMTIVSICTRQKTRPGGRRIRNSLSLVNPLSLGVLQRTGQSNWYADEKERPQKCGEAELQKEVGARSHQFKFQNFHRHFSDIYDRNCRPL